MRGYDLDSSSFEMADMVVGMFPYYHEKFHVKPEKNDNKKLVNIYVSQTDFWGQFSWKEIITSQLLRRQLCDITFCGVRLVSHTNSAESG